MKYFWKIAMAAMVIMVIFTAVHYAGSPGSGDTAPNFTLKTLDGRDASLSDYRGKPVLMIVWATWCGYCKREFPSLVRLSRDMSKEGLVVLAVSVDEKTSDVSNFVTNYSIDFPILMDTNGRVADTYRSYSIPDHFLIDKTGIIHSHISGPVNWDLLDARNGLRKKLGMSF